MQNRGTNPLGYRYSNVSWRSESATTGKGVTTTMDTKLEQDHKDSYGGGSVVLLLLFRIDNVYNGMTTNCSNIHAKKLVLRFVHVDFAIIVLKNPEIKRL